jgi:hypothetical protein
MQFGCPRTESGCPRLTCNCECHLTSSELKAVARICNAKMWNLLTSDLKAAVRICNAEVCNLLTRALKAVVRRIVRATYTRNLRSSNADAAARDNFPCGTRLRPDTFVSNFARDGSVHRRNMQCHDRNLVRSRPRALWLMPPC